VLCGVTPSGDRTYSAEGIIQIAEALKVNQTLQSIKYAADSNQSIAQPCTTSGPVDALTFIDVHVSLALCLSPRSIHAPPLPRPRHI
jgi:hypothetical protein